MREEAEHDAPAIPAGPCGRGDRITAAVPSKRPHDKDDLGPGHLPSRQSGHQASRAEAVIEAARMVDRMLDLGDLDGRDLWRRIRRAIEMLQAPVDRARH